MNLNWEDFSGGALWVDNGSVSHSGLLHKRKWIDSSSFRLYMYSVYADQSFLCSIIHTSLQKEKEKIDKVDVDHSRSNASSILFLYIDRSARKYRIKKIIMNDMMMYSVIQMQLPYILVYKSNVCISRTLFLKPKIQLF